MRAALSTAFCTLFIIGLLGWQACVAIAVGAALYYAIRALRRHLPGALIRLAGLISIRG